VDLCPLQARFLLALLLPLLHPLLERDPVPRRHLARELHASSENFKAWRGKAITKYIMAIKISHDFLDPNSSISPHLMFLNKDFKRGDFFLNDSKEEIGNEIRAYS